MRYFVALAVVLMLSAITPAMAENHRGNGGGGGGRGHAVHGEMAHPPRVHGGHGGGRGPVMVRPRGVKPLGGILRHIKRRHPGQHLDVRPGRGPHGEPHYRVKWLTPEGRVIWLDVDATTGEVMGEGANRGQDGR